MSMVSETRPCIDMKTLEKTQSQRRIHSATYSVSVTSDSPDQTTAQRKSQPIMHLGTSDLSGRTSRTSCENLYDYLDHSSEYETRSAENSFSMTDSDFNLERYLVQSWPQASQLSCEDTSISSLSNHQQSDALVEPSLPSYSYGPFWSSAFTNSRVHARCGSDFPHNTGAAFCDPSAIMVETHHVSSAENGLYDIEPSYLITSHHGDTLDSDTCASHKVAHEDDSIASFSTEAASSPPVKSEDLNPSPKYSEIDAQSDNVDFDEFIKTSSCEPERPKRAAGKARCFCEFCGKPFARTFNYHTHLQTHDPARPRPYQCAYTTCSKSFFRPTDLKRHDQSVSNYIGFRRLAPDK